MRERNHFATALYKFVRHLEIRISQKFELFHFPSPSSPPPFSYTAHFVETTGNELGGVTHAVVVMTIHHHQSYHPTFVIDYVVLLYCVLFSESCSAEQTHPESGAEHQHGTERSYLVIFITCPITSRQHRASAERWSSLHFTSVTVHFSLTRVAVFHLRIMQSFPSIFFFTFMR